MNAFFKKSLLSLVATAGLAMTAGSAFAVDNSMNQQINTPQNVANTESTQYGTPKPEQVSSTYRTDWVNVGSASSMETASASNTNGELDGQQVVYNGFNPENVKDGHDAMDSAKYMTQQPAPQSGAQAAEDRPDASNHNGIDAIDAAKYKSQQ